MCLWRAVFGINQRIGIRDGFRGRWTAPVPSLTTKNDFSKRKEYSGTTHNRDFKVWSIVNRPRQSSFVSRSCERESRGSKVGPLVGKIVLSPDSDREQNCDLRTDT